MNRTLLGTVPMSKMPACTRHPDCHAYHYGHCTALYDTNFGNKDCPFYRNALLNRKEQEDCFQKLIDSGRTDLIKLYLKTLIELGIVDAADCGMEDDEMALLDFEETCRRELLTETQMEDGGWNDEEE